MDMGRSVSARAVRTPAFLWMPIMNRSFTILASFTVFLLVGAALGWGLVAASVGSLVPSAWSRDAQFVCGLAMLFGMVFFGCLASIVLKWGETG